MLIPFFLLISCEDAEKLFVYSASGEYWEATLESSNKDEQFLIEFTFKDDLEDLRDSDFFSFFIVTDLSVYNDSLVDFPFQDEDDQHNTYIEFKKISSNTFEFLFDLSTDTTKQYTGKDLNDSIEDDGARIHIYWGDNPNSPADGQHDMITIP